MANSTSTRQSTCNPANCAPTGFIFADFMVGLPSQAYRVLSEGDAMMRSTFYAGYVQDDWKVSRRLTLNLGLRYENTRPWADKYDGMINVQVTNMGAGPAGAYLIPNAPPPIYHQAGKRRLLLRLSSSDTRKGRCTQVGNQYMGRGLVNPSDRNWGPRIGLAYNPAEHWSIRAGFGMFYVQDIRNIVFDMARNLGGKDGYVIGANQRTTYLSVSVDHGDGKSPVPGLERGMRRRAADPGHRAKQPHAVCAAVPVECAARVDAQPGAGGRVPGK